MYFEYCLEFCIFSRFYVAARAYKIFEALQEMSHEKIHSKVNDFKGEFNLTTLKKLLSD
jgi:hypothetical protein